MNAYNSYMIFLYLFILGAYRDLYANNIITLTPKFVNDMLKSKGAV